MFERPWSGRDPYPPGTAGSNDISTGRRPPCGRHARPGGRGARAWSPPTPRHRPLAGTHGHGMLIAGLRASAPMALRDVTAARGRYFTGSELPIPTEAAREWNI